MKKLIIILLLFFSLSYSGYCADSMGIPLIIDELLINCGSVGDNSRELLENRYDKLGDDVKKRINEISVSDMKERFRAYCEAKRKIFNLKEGDEIDLEDFSWLYILDKYGWAEVTIPATADSVTISEIETGVSARVLPEFAFPLNSNKETAFIVPMKDDEFAIYGKGIKRDYVWRAVSSPSVESPSFFFPQSSSSGVVLIINSTPPEATIYFNKREYYKKTNTSCVRDPGVLKIIIRKEGYLDWEKEYKVVGGEKILIDAALTRVKSP